MTSREIRGEAETAGAHRGASFAGASVRAESLDYFHHVDHGHRVMTEEAEKLVDRENDSGSAAVRARWPEAVLCGGRSVAMSSRVHVAATTPC